MPSKPPAPEDSAAADPEPGRAPPQPQTPPEEDPRGISARGIRTYESVTSRRTPATDPEPLRDTKRKARAFSLPPALVERIADSGMHRTDLLMIAVDRYADHIQHTPRHTTEGRVCYRIYLTDTEHNRLARIAKIRNWSVSATVAVLLDFYLTELEAAQNKKSKRARANP